MATVPQLEAALIKADRAGDTRAAQAIANEIKRVRAQAKPVSRTQAVTSGAVSGFENVSNTIAGIAGGIVDKFGVTPGQAVSWAAKNLGGYSDADARKIARNLSGLPGFGDIVRAGGEARQTRFNPVREQRPNYFAGGQLAGELVATVPLLAAGGGAIQSGGRLLSRGLPSAGRVVQRVGTAVKTGGIGSGRTAAQTAKLTLPQRGADLAQRVAGGAIAGAGGAALTGQDISTGATIGGVLPVAVGAIGGGVGKLVDLFRSDKVQAAKLFREALGTDLEAARQVFANLSPDDQRLARRVLVEANIEPDAFMAMGANMERLRPQQTRLIEEAETAAARQGLARAAGAPGGTVTDVRAATRAGREEVSNAMTPAREGAFAQTAAASDAEVLAQQARQRASAASAEAARQQDDAQRLTGAASYFEDSPAFVRGADAAADRATAASQTAEQQVAVAQQMEDFVHQAAAEGVAPLRGAPLVAALRRMAAQPGTRADDLQRNTINTIADKIERGMDQNGMVNPYDMYQLRKTGVSDVIGELENKITAGNAPRSGNLQRTSKLAGDVQTLIDDALGDPFKSYLDRSAQGYAAVNRQELAGEALRRFDKSPDAFLDLVGRNDPEAVARITQGGPKMEDISNVFAMDPQRLAALVDAQNLLQGRNRMGELTRSGAAKAVDIMNIETPSKMRAATKIAMSTVPAGRIAAEGAETLAGNFMRPKISARLAEGFMPGQSANTLLNTYSTPLMFDDVISRLPPTVRNMLAQYARQSSNSDQR
jgi:hypothetical protein